MNGGRPLEPTPLPLPGALVIAAERHVDARGSFVKTFQASALAQFGLHLELREEFYSVSARHVLRGMHLQTPPAAHTKLVTCVAGRVLDVLLDLRRGSPTRGQYCSLEITAERPAVIWIPPGIAHGFLSLADNSCLLYRTDREHDPHRDAGVRWDSFGFEWPIAAADVIVSERDRQQVPWAAFDGPFTDYEGAKER